MNYYDARPLADGSGWHYTCCNDDRVWAVGYCSPLRDCPACSASIPNDACATCGGKGWIKHEGADQHVHATADEARECFRQYLLDGACEESYGDWTGCTVCDAPTKKGMTERPPLGRGFALCDEHRTVEQLAELTGVPGHIVSSD